MVIFLCVYVCVCVCVCVCVYSCIFVVVCYIDTNIIQYYMLNSDVFRMKMLGMICATISLSCKPIILYSLTVPGYLKISKINEVSD